MKQKYTCFLTIYSLGAIIELSVKSVNIFINVLNISLLHKQDANHPCLDICSFYSQHLESIIV